jgi:hypothetical protein
MFRGYNKNAGKQVWEDILKVLVFIAVALLSLAGAACSYSPDLCEYIDPESLCYEPSSPECHFNGSEWIIRECSRPYGCLYWHTIENCEDLKKCEEDYYFPPKCVCDTGPPSCYDDYLDHGLRDFSTCFSSKEIGTCQMTDKGCPVWNRIECDYDEVCVESETAPRCVDCRSLCTEGTFGICLEAGSRSCDFSDSKKSILMCKQHPTYEDCACWETYRDCGDSRCRWAWSDPEQRYVPYCE